jgi:hypothetical protein
VFRFDRIRGLLESNDCMIKDRLLKYKEKPLYIVVEEF